MKDVQDAVGRIQKHAMAGRLSLKGMVKGDLAEQYLGWCDEFSTAVSKYTISQLEEIKANLLPKLKKMDGLLKTFTVKSNQAVAESVKKVDGELAAAQQQMEDMRDKFGVAEKDLELLTECKDLKERARMQTVAWACMQLLSSKNIFDKKKGSATREKLRSVYSEHMKDKQCEAFTEELKQEVEKAIAFEDATQASNASDAAGSVSAAATSSGSGSGPSKRRKVKEGL